MSKTVIVIDDDFDDYIFLKDALEEYNPSFSCIYFDDSDCAMNTMDSVQHFRPDYVFIDINMPALTGDECLHILRKNPVFKDITIVMFSTFMPNDYAASLKKDGANLTFQKPNSMKEYKDILHQVFGDASSL